MLHPAIQHTGMGTHACSGPLSYAHPWRPPPMPMPMQAPRPVVKIHQLWLPAHMSVAPHSPAACLLPGIRWALRLQFSAALRVRHGTVQALLSAAAAARARARACVRRWSYQSAQLLCSVQWQEPMRSPAASMRHAACATCCHVLPQQQPQQPTALGARARLRRARSFKRTPHGPLQCTRPASSIHTSTRSRAGSRTQAHSTAVGLLVAKRGRRGCLHGWASACRQDHRAVRCGAVGRRVTHGCPRPAHQANHAIMQVYTIHTCTACVGAGAEAGRQAGMV